MNRIEDSPQWGKLHYATSRGAAIDCGSMFGTSQQVRQGFASTGRLLNQITGFHHTWQPLPQGGRIEPPVYAFSHQFDPQSSSGSVLYVVGTTQDPMVKYLTSKGQTEMRPYWASEDCMAREDALISLPYENYWLVQGFAAAWEAQLKDDVASYFKYEGLATSDDDCATKGKTDCSSLSEEESYLAILQLSIRQAMAANVFAYNDLNITMFQKEMSSSGRVNTVDAIYPAMPFYIYANSNML